jgi:hypothetical protein
MPSLASDVLEVSATVPASTTKASARFLRSDGATQGSWKSVFGSEGYMVVGDATNLPAYASVTTTGASTRTWAATTSESRALQKATGVDRVAAEWYNPTSFEIAINLTDNKVHQLAMYVVAWEEPYYRAQRIEVLDAVTRTVLDSQEFYTTDSGQYLVWQLSGNVVIRVTNLYDPYEPVDPDAIVSGLFFDSVLAGTPYVFSLQYVEGSVASPEGDLRLVTKQSGAWQEAVQANLAQGGQFFSRAYNPATDNQIGNSGIDTQNNVVWAVVDYNGTFAVAGSELPPSDSLTFGSWVDGFPLTGQQALPNEDPDGDGWDNLLEFAFDTSPVDPGSANDAGKRPTVGTMADSGSDYLTITFVRRILDGGISYVPQSSGNLADWSGVPVQVGSPIAFGDGILEQVTYRDSAPMTGKRFLRVKVTTP